MLVQHPVQLLLIFLCLQVRSMKLSNARTASNSAAARLPLPAGENHETEQCHHMLVQQPGLLVFLCLQVKSLKLSNARAASSSAAARLRLPAGEKNKTEQCSCNIQFRCCSSSFA
jgi:hypothetical protein